MAKKIGIEIELDSNGAVIGLKNLGDEGKRAGEKIKKSTDEASSSMGGLNASTIVTTGAILAVGAAALKMSSSFISAGFETTKQAQKVETQFKVLLGSAEAAQDRYAELAKSAASTPFTLNGVANASKILETLTNGTLSTGAGLRMVGDAAAISGEQFENLAIHIGRAYSGLQSNRPIGESASRLQELGLVTGETRTKIEELQKTGKGVEAWEILRKELEKTSGGMEALSQTIDGKVSTIKDNIGLISASFLESIGAMKLYNSILSSTADTLDSIMKAQGTYEAMNKQSNLTLNEAVLKRQALSNYLKALPAQATIAIQKTREEIEAIDKLIPKLEAEKLAKDKVTESSKKSQEAKEKLIETQKAETQRLSDNAKEQKKLIDLQRLSNQEMAIKIQQEQQLMSYEAMITNELEYYEIMRTLSEEQRTLELDTHNQRIERINLERDLRIESLKGLELSEQEHSDAVNLIYQNSAKKKRAIEAEQTKATIQSYLSVASSVNSALKDIFGENKAFAIADIAINTARGVQRSFADLPPPANAIQAAAITASGIAQSVKVYNQKYADGGWVNGGGTGRSDSIPAMLSNGEYVINARSAQRNPEAVEALNRGESIGSNINITVNAGMGANGTEIAQIITNEIYRARQLGLEPSLV